MVKVCREFNIRKSDITFELFITLCFYYQYDMLSWFIKTFDFDLDEIKQIIIDITNHHNSIPESCRGKQFEIGYILLLNKYINALSVPRQKKLMIENIGIRMYNRIFKHNGAFI